MLLTVARPRIRFTIAAVICRASPLAAVLFFVLLELQSRPQSRESKSYPCKAYGLFLMPVVLLTVALPGCGTAKPSAMRFSPRSRSGSTLSCGMPSRLYNFGSRASSVILWLSDYEVPDSLNASS